MNDIFLTRREGVKETRTGKPKVSGICCDCGKPTGRVPSAEYCWLCLKANERRLANERNRKKKMQIDS